MRQTLLGSGRKTMVQIPCSKLFPQSTCRQVSQEAPCCDSCADKGSQNRILIGCTSPVNNEHIKAMITEIQLAYDKEMGQFAAINRQLQADRDRCKKQIQLVMIQCDLKLNYLSQTIQLLRRQCQKKDGQIAALIHQKDIIVRNKIEFRQTQNLQRIYELQNVIRNKDLDLAQLRSQLELTRLDKTKIQQSGLGQTIKWQGELKRLNLHILELQNQLQRQRVAHSLNLQKKPAFEQKLDNVNAQNQKFRAQIQERNKDLNKLSYRSEQLQKKVAILQHQKSDMLNRYNQLLDKFSKSQETVLYIDRQKGGYLLELQKNLIQIENLKRQLSSKQKVYQVKIQRVIDSSVEREQLKISIIQLQAKLKQIKLQKQIYAEQVKKSQMTIQELKLKTAKLQAQISALKAYIQKRQGSFKWVVQRQIEKDIKICEYKPQLYKVSQVRQYERDISESAKYVKQPRKFTDKLIVER